VDDPVNEILEHIEEKDATETGETTSENDSPGEDTVEAAQAQAS
jgi:hypothetical protein